MSLVSIRAALEVGLEGLSPAVTTVWENTTFTPTDGVAYQVCTLLPATPVDSVLGSGMHRAVGVLQVLLCYPLHTGPRDAYTRADALTGRFYRGSSWTADTVKVTVDLTPTVGPALTEDGRYLLPVSIPWMAHIFRT